MSIFSICFYRKMENRFCTKLAGITGYFMSLGMSQIYDLAVKVYLSYINQR